MRKENIIKDICGFCINGQNYFLAIDRQMMSIFFLIETYGKNLAE
jgi:hypothetical protein